MFHSKISNCKTQLKGERNTAGRRDAKPIGTRRQDGRRDTIETTAMTQLYQLSPPLALNYAMIPNLVIKTGAKIRYKLGM